MCEQRKRMHEDVYLSWRDPLPLHFSLPFPSLPFPSLLIPLLFQPIPFVFEACACSALIAGVDPSNL